MDYFLTLLHNYDMKGRIIILGNGFDLAHGLKTSYSDFIEYIINQSINNNQTVRDEIIDLGYLYSTDQNFEKIKKDFNKLNSASDKPVNGKIYSTNKFFKALLTTFFSANWVDIEDYYFRYMGNSNSIEELNNEFELVKKHLEEYLLKQQENTKNNSSFFNEKFIDLFKEGNPNSILFLNFNYTSTIGLYLDSLRSIQDKHVVYIHGQLKSEDNPIIFGYGDDSNSDYISYIKRTNDSYLLNLKRQQYNLSSSYQNLKDYIDGFRNYDRVRPGGVKPEIEVYCIGHSLGLSDRTLLNEIFENSLVKRIKLFYYKDREGYRTLNNNISRIASTRTLNNKVINFPNSTEIPQIKKTVLVNKK